MDRYIEPEKNQSDEVPTFRDKALAQLSLIPSTFVSTGDGIVNRVTHLSENPVETGFMVGSSALVGAGLARLARARTPGGIATSCIPYCMGLAAATDITYRIGLPTMDAMSETWRHPGQVDHHADALGNRIGGTMVDFSVMGLGGVSGARGVNLLHRNLARQNAVGQDIRTLTDGIDAQYHRPTGYGDYWLFRSHLREELATVKKNGYTTVSGTELDTATQSLQRVVDKFTTKNNLPHTKVGWEPQYTSVAESLPGQAHINIDPIALIFGRKSKIADFVGHEVTHVEQETIMLRRLADRLGVGVEASAPQMSTLRADFTGHTGKAPSDAFLTDVLAIRKGQPLSKPQTDRAEALLSEEANWQLVMKNGRESDKRLRAIDDAITNMQRHGSSTASELLCKEESRITLLGDATLKPDVLVRLERLAAQTPLATQTKFAEDRCKMLDLLLKQKTAELKTQSHVTAGYHNLLGEKEAWSVGSTAGWMSHFDKRGNRILFGLGTATAGEPAKMLLDTQKY